MRAVRRALGISLAVAAVVVGALPVAPAQADTFVLPAAVPVEYKVTMVARQCDEYTDVFANRARNDIMESLKNLGPDTPYNPFVAIQPSVEDGLAPQSSCVPLPNWRFSFGTGITRPCASTNLSCVTGTGTVANRQVVTQASTPLLDTLGQPTGQTIAGAVTFTLTQTEVDLASRNSRFWVMGGTPSAPLNGQANDFGFAALRCARDNLNGDNVEWIGYPSGQRHVFCYAFYIQPPPGAGTIIIEKEVTTPLGVQAPFDFTGNLSFNPGGRFTLTVPASGSQVASSTFIRAETTPSTPWQVAEDPNDGFDLVAIDCSSTGVTTPSPFTVDLANSRVDIFLQEGETVRCRFVNAVRPPDPGEALILKFLVGPATGIPTDVLPDNWQFPYTDPGGATGTLTVPATDANPSGDSGILTVPSGTWTVGETLPAAAPGWRWEFVAGECGNSDGDLVPVDGTTLTATIDMPAGGNAVCAFVNRLVPLGGLVIRVTTLGGTGTFGFVATNLQQGATVTELVQTATTSTPGTAVVAAGDSTNPLLGQYTVTPVAPSTSAAGRWVIEGLPRCNVTGAPALNIGPEILQVTPGNPVSPVLTCDYVYRLVPPSTLDVSKIVTGAGQASAVVIDVECSDGSTARLQVDPGDPTPARLPAPLSFLDPVTCRVVESSDGTGPGVGVTTTSEVLVDAALADRDPATLAVGAPNVSENVEVRFTNAFQSTSPPTTTPPTTLPPVTLPPTGLSGDSTVTVLLAALVALGGLAALWTARRRTGQPG